MPEPKPHEQHQSQEQKPGEHKPGGEKGEYKPKTLHHKMYGTKTAQTEEEHKASLADGWTEEDPKEKDKAAGTGTIGTGTIGGSKPGESGQQQYPSQQQAKPGELPKR